ncbi:MAG: photosystem II complex extrinsic protein PsbU [Cyanobacteriota bacterium]|nr:photosystem II complex extrinsic protein PsbU [Cyanobacteriota bacterium]
MKKVLTQLLLVGMLVLLIAVSEATAIAANQGGTPKPTNPNQVREQIGICTVTEVGIDLNNANLMAFTDCPGFYPNLASIILSHAPYQRVEEVLSIPDLTDYQRALLKANLANFTVTEPVVPLAQRMPPRINQPAH